MRPISAVQARSRLVRKRLFVLTGRDRLPPQWRHTMSWLRNLEVRRLRVPVFDADATVHAL
jgi:hypothetical protein